MSINPLAFALFPTQSPPKLDDKPSFIENVLTVSKKEIEDAAKNQSPKILASCANTLENNEYIEDVECTTSLCYSKSRREGDIIIADMEFGSDSYHHEFYVNIAFYVKSANYCIRDKKLIKIKRRRKTDNDELSATLCSLSDVLNPAKNFIEDGNLTVHMKAVIYNEEDIVENKHLTLAQLLWERDDHDFTIVVGKEGALKTEIKIHKFVLASRSPVFNRMLETDMKEKAQSKLDIIDFEVKVVQAAVEFFYDQPGLNGKDTDISGIFNDLLRFADKYDIDDLKDKTGHALFFHIFPDTICKIANASVASNAEDLKVFCVRSLTAVKKKKGIRIDNAETLDEEIEKEMEKARVAGD